MARARWVKAPYISNWPNTSSKLKTFKPFKLTSSDHSLKYMFRDTMDKLVPNLTTNTQYNDVIMTAMASPITSLTIVYLNVYSGADKRKHQSSASLAFVRGIHRWFVNSPHKWPVTPEMFPFNYVIMTNLSHSMQSLLESCRKRIACLSTQVLVNVYLEVHNW